MKQCVYDYIYFCNQEKTELLAKIQEYGNYKEKFFKREEANDEIHELANQEMAKVKHLVSLPI